MPITKATASSIAPAAKGDLVVGSATNDAAVLGVGSNDQVLTADSSTATGLKWATAGGGTPANDRGTVVTSTENTTSTSYTGLSTAITVTLTTGTKALVCLSCNGYSNNPSGYAYTSVAVSGATTVAASDTYGIRTQGTPDHQWGTAFLLTGLTAGSNTFTMQHRTNNSSYNGGWSNRILSVIDMGS